MMLEYIGRALLATFGFAFGLSVIVAAKAVMDRADDMPSWALLTLSLLMNVFLGALVVALIMEVPA